MENTNDRTAEELSLLIPVVPSISMIVRRRPVGLEVLLNGTASSIDDGATALFMSSHVDHISDM